MYTISNEFLIIKELLRIICIYCILCLNDGIQWREVFIVLNARYTLLPLFGCVFNITGSDHGRQIFIGCRLSEINLPSMLVLRIVESDDIHSGFRNAGLIGIGFLIDFRLLNIRVWPWSVAQVMDIGLFWISQLGQIFHWSSLDVGITYVSPFCIRLCAGEYWWLHDRIMWRLKYLRLIHIWPLIYVIVCVFGLRVDYYLLCFISLFFVRLFNEDYWMGLSKRSFRCAIA